MADAQNHRLKTYPYSQLLRSQTYTFVIMFLLRLTKVFTLFVCNIHLNQTKNLVKLNHGIYGPHHKKACKYRRTSISGRSDFIRTVAKMCDIAYVSNNGADQTVY